MSYVERALQFTCQDERLLGVLSSPKDAAPSGDGVVIVVGGPQYRAGSHRQFVSLARTLAAQGHHVLRFDVRGMGDSSGPLWHFESLTLDIAAAIDALILSAPSLRRVVLAGLCDGASASLMYMNDTQDPRIKAMCLLNPWMRSNQSLARTHVKHYYWRRFLSPSFWRKLLGGGIGFGVIRDLSATLRSAFLTPARPDSIKNVAAKTDFRLRMMQGLKSFVGDTFLGISSADLTAQEFLLAASANGDWREVLAKARLSRAEFIDADHTLSEHTAQLAFEAAVAQWLEATG